MKTAWSMQQEKNGPIPYRYASHTVHDNLWGGIGHLHNANGRVDDSMPDRRDRVRRILGNYSGPIIWALEIIAVLLIVADHFADFIDAVIAGDFVIIVLMIAFRAACGRRRKSHHTATLEMNRKVSVDDRQKHAIGA